MLWCSGVSYGMTAGAQATPLLTQHHEDAPGKQKGDQMDVASPQPLPGPVLTDYGHVESEPSDKQRSPVTLSKTIFFKR